MNKLLQKVKENLNLKVILGFVVMTVIFMVGRSVVYVNEIEPRREVFTRRMSFRVIKREPCCL